MKKRFFAVVLCVVLMASFFAVPASAASVVKVMKVNVDGARLRKSAGASEIITSLKKGAKVLYTGKKVNAFLQVRTTNGKVGYIYKPFLSSYGAANSKQVYYTTKKVHMFKKPSAKSSKVKKLKAHTLVLVYEVRGSWAYVKTLSGKGGFVKASCLSKA